MASGHCAVFVFVFVSVSLWLLTHSKGKKLWMNHCTSTFPQESDTNYQSDLKSVSTLQLTQDREQILHFITLLITVPNVKYTKEGGPGMNFKGHPILTMQCRIWLHFLCGVIDLIGSQGTNEPNTENRDEPGHFDDIILLCEMLPVPSVEKIEAWCGGEWTLMPVFSFSCQRLIHLFLWYWRWLSLSCFVSNGLYLDHCLILNSCIWEIGLEKGLCCLQWNIMSISSPVQFDWICQFSYF